METPNSAASESWNHAIPGNISVGLTLSVYHYLPFIEVLNGISCCCMQNSHKVSKDCFPNPNFELMQEVHDKQDEQVESKPREFL